MERKTDLYWAIDACRDSGALSLPEMDELREALSSDPELRAILGRSQAVDRVIGNVLHQIDVPEGLGERLLAGQRRVDRLVRRRRFIKYGGFALAGAAGGLFALGRWFWRPTPSEIEPLQLATGVLDQMDQRAEWPRVTREVVKDFPLLLHDNPRIDGWMSLPAELGKGVVYRLAPNHPMVKAFAISRRLTGDERTTELPRSLPLEPVGMSQKHSNYGWGACRRDDVLFVLLVEPKERYSSYLGAASLLSA